MFNFIFKPSLCFYFCPIGLIPSCWDSPLPDSLLCTVLIRRHRVNLRKLHETGFCQLLWRLKSVFYGVSTAAFIFSVDWGCQTPSWRPQRQLSLSRLTNRAPLLCLLCLSSVTHNQAVLQPAQSLHLVYTDLFISLAVDTFVWDFAEFVFVLAALG